MREKKNVNIVEATGNYLKDKVNKTVLTPLDSMVDQNLTDIVTTIGAFVIRNIRGKFQRSITFSIGENYADRWMEEALYGILYQYNDLKHSSQLEITNKRGVMDGTGMYYRLADGTHSLKYRKWNILLAIQTPAGNGLMGRQNAYSRTYTVITYDTSPDFCKYFEKDMLSHRNALLQIKANSPTVTIYQDLHEADGYTYWERSLVIPKRHIGTVYMEREKKVKLVNTINEFFSNKEFYQKHGIAHNLKILLYGPPGPQPVDTLIPTPSGFKPLGNIEPGDLVFDGHGNPTKVTELYHYDQLQVVKVTFDDNTCEYCAETHKFPITGETGYRIDLSPYRMIQNLVDEDGNPRYRIKLDLQLAPAFPHLLMQLADDETIDELAMHMIQFLNGMAPKHSAIIEHYYLIERLSVEKRMDYARKVILHLWNNDSNGTNVNYEYGNLEIFSKDPIALQSFTRILRGLGFKVYHHEMSMEIALGKNRNGLMDLEHMENPPKELEDCKLDPGYKYITAIEFTSSEVDMTCLHVESEEHTYLGPSLTPLCNSGKDSIAKMIASEWNRNIYYVTGGKGGKFVPNAITDSDDDDVNHAMVLISDIDKFPFLINEVEVDVTKEDAKEEAMQHKQTFGAMINALDGVLSAEDRIIVMTTNHIEKFSDTFLRPGRIDLQMEIGYVTPDVFRQYVWDFFHTELSKDIQLKDKELTIAKMQFDVVFQKLPLDDFLKKYLK